MRTQVLILGIAIGCAVVAATALVTQQRTARAALQTRGVPAAEHGEVTAPDPLLLAARPAPQLTATAGLGTREIQEQTGGEDALRQARALLEPDLLAELETAYRLGLLGDTRLGEFLAQLYLERGLPVRALAVLQRVASKNVNLWANVAQAFANAGDVVGQKEALLAALAIAPQSEPLLDALGRLEPELAVSRLSLLLAAEPPPGNRALRAGLASALLRSGRAAEARALIDGLILENPNEDQAIRLLAELDPARAIELVERQMAAAAEPADLRGTLVQLMTRAGDLAGAEAMLERCAREGQYIGPDEWGLVAQMWLEADESERGLAAMERALLQEHDDPDPWVHSLAELAPADLLRALERRVASDEAANDEYWGSLADSYWAAGRRSEARSAWERARALDPDDGEWSDRLRALDHGGDPYED